MPKTAGSFMPKSDSGEGDDGVVLSDAFTKAHNMGAGNDTVTYGGAASTTTGAVGSMNAGDGTDTIIMTDAQAAAADGTSAFNKAFTNFEVLRISDAFAENALDLDGINGVSQVRLAAGIDGTAAINNLSSGGTVRIDANGANTPALTVGVKGAVLGAADVLNLTLSKTSALAVGSVTAANVETVNIATPDAAEAPALGSNAAVHTMTLAATSATTVTVAGNNGLTLTNTNNDKITRFDASGVVANNTAASTYVAATTDSAANLAVTFASANTTASANVTIIGGAGNDTLSGTIAKDNISGGAGIDTIYADNAGDKATTATADIAIAGPGTGTVTVKIGFAGLETAALTVTKADATNTTLAEIGVGIRAALAADPVLSKLIAISGTAPAVVFTSLVDGVLAAPTVTFTKTGADAVTYTVGALTAGTAGTVAVDVIDGGAGADVIVGGGGADTITTGAGADTVFFLKPQSNLATMATITDYTYAVGGSSNDKIVLGDVTTVIGTTTTVQDLSSAASLSAALTAAALTNTVDAGLSVFIYGGDTYAYVETTGATATYQAADFVVKLTGTPLAAGSAIAGTGFDAV